MSNHPTVDDVMAQWLTDNGYDGLVNEDLSCACKASDLRPCGEAMGTCMPGHEVACKPDDCDVASYIDTPCDWHIAAGPKPTDSDL